MYMYVHVLNNFLDLCTWWCGYSGNFVPSAVLFKSFLKVERIKQHFKGTLVGMVLNGYLSLKR